MSQWTHVTGVIRYDGIVGMTPKPDLGKTVSWEDDENLWDECDVPCGSEGSLQTTLWENPNPSAMARWTATIFGDLRDYSDVFEVLEYFMRITKGHMIRSGVFTVQVEYGEERTYRYGENGWIMDWRKSK